jgi:hypothetical protein
MHEKSIDLDEFEKMLRRCAGDKTALIIKKIEEKKFDVDTVWLAKTMLKHGVSEDSVFMFLSELKLSDREIQLIMRSALRERGDRDVLLRVRSDDSPGASISTMPLSAMKKLDEFE